MVSDQNTNLLLLYLIMCLNPYSTGRWFLIQAVQLRGNTVLSLNPYSTGRWFLIEISDVLVNSKLS